MAKQEKAIPVFVTLRSVTRSDMEEVENLRLRCHGELRRGAAGGYLLRYVEVQDDPESGHAISQDVVLSLQPERVTMNRLGQYGTTMVFVKDRRFEGAYHTPYGDLCMALFATQVICSLGPESGTVHLEYQLDMQGNDTATQIVDVSYAADGAALC